MPRDLEKDKERLAGFWKQEFIDASELLDIANSAVNTAISYEAEMDRLINEIDILQEQLNQRGCHL